jgi:DUF4097 and DUF4098 domain-containing protein YvlB/uncharacterized membrane protein HdeD (DUF308 family)
LLGLILVAAGGLFFIAPGSATAAWIVRLWPVFLICAGVARIMGFAVERRPRTPIGGLLLVIVGALFLASRFHPDLNAIEIYGRYWVLLLVAFGSVEVVRHYSHRPGYGQPPKLFTIGRLLIVLAILVSGVLASRLGRNQSLLSALHVEGLLGGVRDSLVGQSYVFTDEGVTTQLKPGQKVTIDNRYGSVKVSGGGSTLRATLVKTINAWGEDEARRTAQQIKLVILEDGDALTITTNRAELDGRFTTDIQVDLPPWTQLSVSDTFGSVAVDGLESDVFARVSHGDVALSRIDGDVVAELNYCDFNVSDVTGNVKASGFKRASATNVSGSVDFSGRSGSVELHKIGGAVQVEAPRSRISCRDLSSEAWLKTDRGAVDVDGVGDLSVEAPGSEVRAANVRGDARVNSSRGSIKVSSISGDLEIDADNAAVTAENVQGEARIQTSRGEVLMKGFREAAHVLTSYRDVTLVPACEPTGDIEVTNSHGGIKVVLPASSRFLLDAASEGGRVRSSGFNWLSSDGERVNFAFGANRPTIKLRTSYKDVWVQAGGPGAVEAMALAK